MNKVDKIREFNNAGVIEPKKLLEHFKHIKSKRFIKKIKEYANENIFIDHRYLFIKKEKKNIYAKCSHCGHVKTIDKVPKQRSVEYCEKCNSKLYVRNIKYGNFADWSYLEYIHFDQSSLDKNILIAYQFGIKRNIDGNEKDINSVGIRDEISITGYYYFDLYSKSRVIENCAWSHGVDMKQSVFIINAARSYMWGYSLESLEEVIEKTDLKYSEYETFLAKRGQNIIKYLDTYCKHPQIEYMMKSGFERLITGYIEGQSTYRTINWRSKTLKGMLKLNKNEIELYKKEYYNSNKNEFTNQFANLKIIQILKTKKWINEEDIKAANELKIFCRTMDEVDETLRIDRPSRILKYLKRQLEDTNNYLNLREVYLDFYDLIKDMKILEMAINKKTLYYKDLKRHHMNISKQIKIKVNLEYDKEIEGRLSKLNKYEFENEKFILSPAKSTEQLILEGKILKHCVGGYGERYKNGKTNIFLLREKQNIYEPFFTIEIDIGFKKIIQCHGKSNITMESDKEVEIFLENFKKQLLNKKEKV